MQSAPRRRSYQRAPTITCSSCCTSCPPPVAMLWSCSQCPSCSQVLPFTLPRQCLSPFPGTAFHHVQAVPFAIPMYCLSRCPGSAFHHSHVQPFMMSRQCLSQSPFTASHDVQAMPFTMSRQCLSQFPCTAFHDVQAVPVMAPTGTAFHSFNAALCRIGTSALHHACCY